ncbi:MAG: DUF2301 domain-containing membrane protein [Nitrospiraceae bacterium]|nr:DUF2301 domain-containing membrane protein [Nitrospiraceae bacterium]
MGERQIFQPLTTEDRVTVVLYRVGIVAATAVIVCLAGLVATGTSPGSITDALGYGLYLSVGLSVFFIHLYIGKFKTYLKNLYFLSLGCLIVLLIIGKGSLSAGVARPYGALLLLPLSGCLGFVTAKEAFCFKLLEGYLLAMIMPLYLLLASAGVLGGNVVSGLVLIAGVLLLFTMRKVFMPLAYDIGDKTAYQ